ncbi:MAG: hypothetical protein VYC34_02460, partial [Planctomycetota bacterium]|nr:hypothetical protein [Planctomycetota bacterium]
MIPIRTGAAWLALASGLGLALAAESSAEFIAYVSSLSEDSVMRLQDLNGDGDYNDAGEATLFFGPGNAAGFPGVGSAQCLLALGFDDVLAGEGEESGAFETRVYRLRDLNNDGDAMDPGEATIYWDSILPSGANFDRPKEITIGPDGALYLSDNNTINFDNDTPEAVWRLHDLNADGDVNDPGEVTIYRQLSPVGEAFGFISEDFKWLGDRLFFSNQDSSTNTGAVWIIEPGGGLTQFVDGMDLVGVSLRRTGMTLSAAGNPVFSAIDIFDIRRIVELIDMDSSGMIESFAEARTLYRTDVAAEVFLWNPNNILDVDFAPDGALWQLELAENRILRFADSNADGDYNDAGEVGEVYRANVAASNGGFASTFPRTVAFIAGGCRGDFNGDGVVNSADLGELLGAWGVSGIAAAPTDLDGD